MYIKNVAGVFIGERSIYSDKWCYYFNKYQSLQELKIIKFIKRCI